MISRNVTHEPLSLCRLFKLDKQQPPQSRRNQSICVCVVVDNTDIRLLHERHERQGEKKVGPATRSCAFMSFVSLIFVAQPEYLYKRTHPLICAMPAVLFLNVDYLSENQKKKPKNFHIHFLASGIKLARVLWDYF